MGSAGESEKKVKMLMTFRTETGLRSPTAPIALSQQNQNILAESHDKHYETSFSIEYCLCISITLQL